MYSYTPHSVIITPPLGSVGGWTELVRRSRGADGFLIATGNATYYNNTNSAKKRRLKRRCLNGFVDNSINVSIKILKLISFILTRRGGPFGVHASSWWLHKRRN